MIEGIIAILVLILIALMVDWSKIVRRRANRTERPAAVKKRQRNQPDTKIFNFDHTPEEAVEQVVADEEPSSANYSKEVEDLLVEADVHFRKGEMKAAEELYVRAAAKDPRCSKAYSRLGVIYLENGDNWEDAESAFRQAIKTDPKNGFILNNLGLVLYHQDKYADAIRHFEQAVRQDEYNASRHANLGMAYMAIRQYAKAESSFKKALKLAPNEMEYKDLLNESIEKKKAHKTMVRR
ncbi:tetratricopeptide repeat protein [Patescibacteria group bacterium]|nr:tetratricopeptide repeat protein [Patescibacteria group bacterium]